MTAVLTQLRDLFIAPSEPAPAVQVAERAAPATIAVLCAPSAAATAGVGVALVAARRAGAACAVVCRWSGSNAAAGPAESLAVPAARRLASRLSSRGLDARARGRLVTVTLPAEAVAARAAAERAAAAAGDTPVVVVLAGPRTPEFDPLLAAQDRLVVVPPPDAAEGLEALALAEAARLGRATGVLRLPAGGSARALAGGLLLAPALRAAAEAALDGHAS
jgi:hypothetical protein